MTERAPEGFVETGDLKMPAIGLGTWQLTGSGCLEAVRAAIEIGYRHVDTAQAYGNQREVGRGLRDSGIPRQDVFLTTKVWFENLDRQGLLDSVRSSLDELDTGYVDLLLIHWPNPGVPLDETLAALDEVRRDGQARCIGASNFTPSLIRQTLAAAAPPIACHQIEYHPFLSQWEHLRLAGENGFAITAYSPLARGAVFDDEAIRAVAERHGRTPAQVSLRWLIQQDGVAAIPKSSSREHLAENFALDFELDSADMRRIARCAREERLVDPEFAPQWRS